MADPSLVQGTGNIFQALAAIGRALGLTAIYGPDHFRTQQAVEEAWRTLASELKAKPEISIGLGNGQLLVNGSPVDTRRQPQVRTLENRLASLKTNGFSIHRDLNEAGFKHLMSLLFTARAGDFDKTLKESSLPGIYGGQLVWTSAMSKESPGVLSRTTNGAEGGRGAGGATDTSSRTPAEAVGMRAARTKALSQRPPSPSSWPDSDPRVQQIIAFLKGDATADTPETRQAVAQFTGDADRLASLILKAATIYPSSADVSAGESLADVVIGCLRRAYQGARGSGPPPSKTRRPELRKALLLLESNILRRLHELTQREDPAADARISQAIQELTTEAEIDLVAAELLEHRKGIERTETRLRQYAQSHSAQMVEAALKGVGLPESEWRKLVITGHGGSGGGESEGGKGKSGFPSTPAGLGALALALERFEALMRGNAEELAEANRLADMIRQGVESATRTAESAVERLEREINKSGRPAVTEGHVDKFKRDELIEILAEIAQELLQPLTVINCTLSMSLGGEAGQLSPEQENLLRMAQYSGERLDKIVQHLIRIVGYPTRLTVPGPANPI